MDSDARVSTVASRTPVFGCCQEQRMIENFSRMAVGAPASGSAAGLPQGPPATTFWPCLAMMTQVIVDAAMVLRRPACFIS
jgi:hypothetical protein